MISRNTQHTGCSLNVVFFPYNFGFFRTLQVLLQALVFYLPCVCTHTDTEGEQTKVRVWNILKSSEETQFLMNTPYNIVNLYQ